MKCHWEDTGPWVDGRRPVGCTRSGCYWRTHPLHPTPHQYSEIYSDCTGIPRWHEFGNWIEIILEVFGITEQRHSGLLWRFGLIEIPETGCVGCERRKEWLNTFGGKLSQSTAWIGRLGFMLLVRRRTSPVTQNGA